MRYESNLNEIYTLSNNKYDINYHNILRKMSPPNTHITNVYNTIHLERTQ